MPILNFEENEALEEDSPSSVVFDKDEKLENIIRNIKGMKWSVDYYLQIRENDEPFIQLDINAPVSIQKYTKIKNLDLLVQNTFDQDKTENITGSAIVFAGFVPNIGDMFVVNLTGNRPAMFVINDVEIKTYNISTAYTLNYKLYCLLDSDPQYLDNIEYKTMNTLVYNRNYMIEESSPVLTEHTAYNRDKLKKEYSSILDRYLLKFTNKSRITLSYRDNGNFIIDGYLVNFVKAITEVNENKGLVSLMHISVTKDYTIWDALLEQDIDKLSDCSKSIKFIHTNIRSHWKESRLFAAKGFHYITDKVEDFEEYYLFDYSFYELRKPNNELERLVFKYLNKEKIETEELLLYSQKLKKEDHITQYYYTPILLLLLKSNIRKNYDFLV